MTDENEDRIRELLRSGGLTVTPDGDRDGHYDPTGDPLGAEELGRALAAAVRDREPSAVMIWHDVADAVLAHVVARELAAHTVIAFDADGLVAHSGRLESGERVVLLTDAVDDLAPLEAMATYARQCGAAVTALALLVRPARDVLGDVPTVALIDSGMHADVGDVTVPHGGDSR